MKTSRIIARTIASVALIIASCAAVAVWQANQVKAFNPQPDPPAFAAAGITNGQTALITARLDADESRSGRGAQPVQVELLFHDSDGNVLARSVQTVEPEHVVWFMLTGGDLPIRGDGMRFEIQPCVKILNDPNNVGQVRLIGGLEVFDNSGPDAGKSRMGLTTINHNETLLRDAVKARRAHRN